jgi:hypothetical protein
MLYIGTLCFTLLLVGASILFVATGNRSKRLK